MELTKEKKKSKLGLVLGIVAVFAVVAVALFVLLGKKEETYRNIRVTEVSGDVVVNRENLDNLNVQENMNLLSGDEVLTGEGAKLTLRLDDDKYIVVDENSKLLLFAEGTEEDSKTRLEVEYGAVFSDIKNKLSESSDYEVVTPSSTMSVRGTQFEVVYRELRDKDGKVTGKQMKVLTFEGAVQVAPEGKKEEARVSTPGTMEVLVEVQEGGYEFEGETKKIEAKDLSEFSATYLKEDISKNIDKMSEEEKEQKEALLETVEEYLEVILPEIKEEEEKAAEVTDSAELPGMTPTPTLLPTAIPVAPEVTVTSIPEATPTPMLGVLATPTPTPCPTLRPIVPPTLTPTLLPTPTLVPTQTPEPTPTLAPTPTLTPTLVPTPIPTPTPTPAATITLKYYVPRIMKDLNGIVAEDAMDILNELSEYTLWTETGATVEVVSMEEQVSPRLMATTETLVTQGEILSGAVALYGEGTTVSCDGWYDSNGKYFSIYGGELFSNLGIPEGGTLELYASYTVCTDTGNITYVPCILEADVKLGFFNPKPVYMMALPAGEQVTLPEVEGYTLSWMQNGAPLSSDTITISNGFVNRYGLVVKME